MRISHMYNVNAMIILHSHQPSLPNFNRHCLPARLIGLLFFSQIIYLADVWYTLSIMSFY